MQGEVGPLPPEQRTNFSGWQRRKQFDQWPGPGEMHISVGRIEHQPRRGWLVFFPHESRQTHVRWPGEVRMFQHRIGQARVALQKDLDDLAQPRGPVLFAPFLLALQLAIKRENGVGDFPRHLLWNRSLETG